MKKQTIELLAPAGSWEALEAAVNAGADAVYMGGKAFGARQYASNFDREEMQKAVYFAHMHRVSQKHLILQPFRHMMERHMLQSMITFLFLQRKS